MKKIVSLLMIILWINWLNAQQKKGYATLAGDIYITDFATGGGPSMSGGTTIKNLSAGIGLSILFFGPGEKNLIPFFGEISYFGKEEQITPFGQFRMGAAIYRGTGAFIGEDRDYRGGLYLSGKAGVAIPLRTTKVFFGGGISMFELRTPNNQHQYDLTTWIGTVTAGFRF